MYVYRMDKLPSDIGIYVEIGSTPEFTINGAIVYLKSKVEKTGGKLTGPNATADQQLGDEERKKAEAERIAAEAERIAAEAAKKAEEDEAARLRALMDKERKKKGDTEQSDTEQGDTEQADIDNKYRTAGFVIPQKIRQIAKDLKKASSGVGTNVELFDQALDKLTTKTEVLKTDLELVRLYGDVDYSVKYLIEDEFTFSDETSRLDKLKNIPDMTTVDGNIRQMPLNVRQQAANQGKPNTTYRKTNTTYQPSNFSPLFKM